MAPRSACPPPCEIAMKVFSRFSLAAFLLTVFVLLTFAECKLAVGQTETVLHNFGNNGDGAYPAGSLVFDKQGNLYGTTGSGGMKCKIQPVGCGTVFELSPNGSGGWTETVLYKFSGGSDGGIPVAGLIFDQNGNLYGTTSVGGSSCPRLPYGCGTVFELTSNSGGGWTESVLYSFKGRPDGASPSTALIFDQSGNLYGTTVEGGIPCPVSYYGCGTVFELTPYTGGGWTETIIYNFSGGTDGAFPLSDLIFDQVGSLYGTTEFGGQSCSGFGCGTVFQLTPSITGWTETVLYRFAAGSDGDTPTAGVRFDKAGNLYGTTSQGGKGCGGACGTVFELSSSNGGWTETVLYRFQGTPDGADPSSGVILDQVGNLYGAAGHGGTKKGGAIFKLTHSGSNWVESILYDFPPAPGGSDPAGGVVFGTLGGLYGTTVAGGADNEGVVYKIAP